MLPLQFPTVCMTPWENEHIEFAAYVVQVFLLSIVGAAQGQIHTKNLLEVIIDNKMLTMHK